MSRFQNLMHALGVNSDRAALEGLTFRYTYAQLLDEFNHWGHRIDGMQAPPGAVIGLRSDYSLPAVSALLALMARGLVPSLIPRDGSADDYLEYSRASGLLDFGSDMSPRYATVANAKERHPLLEELRRRSESGFIIFTSGSTGRPKATLHSLERFLHKFDRPGRSLRTLAFLLFDHVAGLDTLFYTLRNGGTLILTQQRDPRTVLHLIASRNVEVLPTSPSFLRLLCAAGWDSGFDLSPLKIITYGSELMDAATLQRVNEQFPSVRIVQKYGTTELGAPRTISRSNDSLWVKFAGDTPQVKVVDGVLWLRGEGTMLGYLNADSPDAQTGWYCTGDLVEVDGEWLRFIGRADTVVKIGGERVSPDQVEHVIRELAFVSDALVFSEPHPLMGQVLAAQVSVGTCRPAHSQIATTIRNHCRYRLGPHHVPLRVTLVADGSFQTLGYRLKRQGSSILRDGSVTPSRDTDLTATPRPIDDPHCP